MKYYLIAGEASGDIYGGLLIEAIAARDEKADFHFWGGEKMADAAGVKPYKHYKETAIMGFWEVVIKLRTVLGFISECKKHIAEINPDVIILIDYPGFNLRIAEWAHKAEYRVQYFIAPKVWAWKESRVKKIEKYVDRLYAILPFEVEYFKRHGVEAEYYGHPLLQVIADYDVSPHFIAELKQKGILTTEKEDNKTKPIVGLLPGSRKQEITHIFPTMVAYAIAHPEYHFLVAQAPNTDKSLFGNASEIPSNIYFFQNANYDIFSVAGLAIVASGTATLEAALFDVPQVVVYKGNWISYQIAKAVVKLDYVGLVNLIMDKEVITELLQIDYTIDRLEAEISKLNEPIHQAKLRSDYARLKELLKPADAIERISAEVYGIGNLES